MHVAEKAVLPTPESMPCHWHGYGNIDSYHAHFDRSAEFPGNIAIPRIASNAVAELMRVYQINGLLKRWYANTCKHRPEDLLPVNPHSGSNAVKQRTTGKEALLMTGHLKSSPIDQQLGAFVDTNCNVALDPCQGLSPHHGPHFGVRFEAVSNLQQ